MSQTVAYRAAEYFIEVSKKSATFQISYHGINLLLQHSSPDINSYFKKEGKNDVLFVFKQFPDVFILNGSDITLTDAFLALYAFPESAEFRPTYRSDSVFETSVIEYFKLILVRCGACNYLKLFNVLLTQNNLLADHFSHYTDADIYFFFLKYKSTFSVINDNVYLNRAEPINFKTFDDHFCEKSLNKLTKITCFLLTCFDSLHYIELRQLISFASSDLMNYLNMHSLIKQRKIFENLSNTVMDKMGFVSLKNFESILPRSKNFKLVLLIVCILAFEKEIHYLKVGEIIQEKVSSEISSVFCNLSTSEKFKFFKELSNYFWMYDDGYVTLPPSFIFPSCTFDSSLSNDHTNFLRLQPSAFMEQSDVDITVGVRNLNIEPCDSIIGANVLPEDSTLKCSNNNSVKSPVSQNLKLLNSSSPGLKSSPCLIDVRLKLAIIFLMKNFRAPICKNIFKSCLYVLNDVQLSFLKLPLLQQINYLKECYTYFDNLSKEGLLSGVPSACSINDRERILLFIVYLLINKKVMLFEKLSWWLDSSKIDSAFSELSVPGKLTYFKSMSDYLTVSVIGKVVNVSLNKLFDSVNTIIDSHYDILLKLSSELKNETVVNNEGISSEKEKASKKSLKQNFVHNIVPSASDDAVNELNMPLDLYKKLQSSIICLQNWFDILCTEDILQAFLYAVNDINNYFVKLSITQQHTFISNFFKYTSSKSFNEMSLKHSSLTEDEKALLAITYLLIQSKTMHYKKIVEELKAFRINTVICDGEAKQQFRIFKTLNDHFDICGNGFVKFSSAYSVLMSTINPILINLQSKKNTVVNDQNNIVEGSKDLFVDKNEESFILPKSVISKQNKPTYESSKHSFLSRKNEEGADNELNIPLDTIYKKLRVSMICLQNWFDIHDTEDVLKTFLYALKDINTYFVKLSTTEQQKFILNYFQYTSSKSFNEVSLKDTPLTEEEKALLAITYLLIQNNALYYKKIIEELKAFKIRATLCLGEAKQQFEAFKTLNNYFDVHENGLVKLSSMYFILMSTINPILFYLQLKKNVVVNDQNNTVQDSKDYFVGKNEDSFIYPKSVTSKQNKPTNESSKHSFISRKNEECVPLEGTDSELNIPLDIYKKLQVSIICLQNFFDILCTEDILKTFLYSVKDINTYFVKLSATEQEKFILNYLQYTSSKSFNEVSLKDTPLTEEEKALLAITYLLIQNNAMHYKKIVEELKAFYIRATLCFGEAKQQFEAFKTLNNYFDVCENGLVKLSSAYFVLMSTINPILFYLQLKKNTVVNDQNNIVQDSKDYFVCKNEESFISPKSVTSKHNIPSNDSSRHTFRSPTIKMPSSKDIRDLLNSPKNYGVISQQNTLTLKPSTINQTMEQKFFKLSSSCALNDNFSITESESSDISPMARKCDYSWEYKSKQNLNASAMQENTFNPSSAEDNNNDALHGLKLFSSFHGDSVPCRSSCANHNLKCQNCPTPCNYDYPTNHQNVSSASGSCFFGAEQDNTKTSYQFACKSMPSKSSAPREKLPSFDVVEIQAVNFFSVILGNYETGVSADFLMKHLDIASEEVHNFMLGSFQSDAVSFFMKHEAAFYVSPATKNIFLVKKS